MAMAETVLAFGTNSKITLKKYRLIRVLESLVEINLSVNKV